MLKSHSVRSVGGTVVGTVVTEVHLITPDEARMRMLTPRELSAKTIADAIEEFCEDGDPGAPIEFVNLGDPDIAELLRYQEAGWVVKFEGDRATISLPAVLS